MSTPAGNFRPMLSGKAPADLNSLRYPVLVSPKLDGIRCIIINGVAMSRNLKPIPNRYVQSQLAGISEGWDGELIVGKPTGGDVWNRSQSGVMSESGTPQFTFWLFDDASFENLPFGDRYHSLTDAKMPPNVRVVPHHLCSCKAEVDMFEDHYVREGYEGLMIRDPKGPYKCGRSTTKEGYLMKLKRFEDAEAIVVGVVEKFHNANAAKKDELGRTKRSSAKAGKKATGVMGALKCYMRDKYDRQVEFEIGTGFCDADRLWFWQEQGTPQVHRRVVKFKYQGLTPEGIPRFPVFLGFRSEDDIAQAA